MDEKIEYTFSEICKSFKRNEYFLIDIRSYEERIIDGFIEDDDLFRPIDLLFENFDEIPKDKVIIFYCRSGVRSLMLVNFFKDKKIFKKVLSLKGGIIDYRKNYI
jgi:rhodanese-related sulfurtransferase